MTAKFNFRQLVLALFIICSFSLQTQAQVIQRDLSSVKIDDLTDNQIRQITSQGQSENYTVSQILRAARMNGLPEDQVRKLEVRLGRMNNTSSSNQDTIIRPRTVTGLDTARRYTETDTLRKKIFGSELFSSGNLTFEPNLRLATPTNYVIGPDDQLNIAIFGRSVANWKLTVSPDGNINIPAVGVVNVAGKTIEQATANIQRTLNAANYNIGSGTSLNITLGNIRSIKVMLVGELVKPGTYTLPSLATVFNALYASGGPNNNGSFREIELIRNNKVIRRLDVYDFLLNGTQENNIGLKDMDIIRVPTYKVRVEVEGYVKRPAIFEVVPGEFLSDVIRFAGGFADDAYTDKIKAEQIVDQERQLLDIMEDDLGNYIPLRGDKYVVERILDRYRNRVSIQGAVFRPGDYSLEKGLTVAALIKKASGLKEGAFSSRGLIRRMTQDNTSELLSFNTLDVVNESAADIPLQREDIVTIPNIDDLRDEYYVSINGQVRNPGEFGFAENMTVEDLIVLAGGFTEKASSSRISVARRVNNADPTVKNSSVADISMINSTQVLDVGDNNFVLKPFDMVNIYVLPGFEKQRVVTLEGEVLYPGEYVIEKNDERISDVIKRAGGFTASANIQGGTLQRVNKTTDNRKESKAKRANQNDDTSLEMDSVELDPRLERLNKLQLRTKSDTTSAEEVRNEYVGIELDKIMVNPASVTNIILEDGDVLRIPKEQTVVHINGEVLQNSAVVYQKSKSLRDYIYNAGGYTPDALKQKSYVIYANGSIEGTRKFLFFHFHPKIKPGSTIYVPEKPPRNGISTSEFVGIGGTLVSVAAILLSVFKP